MNRILKGFCLALAMALLPVCKATNYVPIASVIFTNTPADGDTVTVNGVVRTFKTSVTSAATQIAIGANTNLTAADYKAQIDANLYAGISAHQSGGSVFLIGSVNVALTASLAGSWGVISVVNQPLTNYTAILPFSSYPSTNRQMMGNLLVDAISTYPSLSIPAGAVALSNFVSLAGTFSGVSTNARTTNNAFVHTLKFMATQGAYLNGANLDITNETPLLTFYDTVGGADQKRTRVIADLSGWNIYFYNDALSAYSNVFTIARNSTYGGAGATFRTVLTAPLIYSTILSNSPMTNMPYSHSLVALMNAALLTGTTAISNTAPTLTLMDTDAASGSQQFLLKADANTVRLGFADDTGAIPLSPRGDVFTVSRTHGTDATQETMNIYPAVQFNSTVQFLTGDIVSSLLARIGNGVIIGTGGGTNLPTGASQALMLAPGAGPSGTLSGSSIFWSSGGEAFYRNGLSNEGDVVDNRLFNRVDEVFGAGTDYTLTGSTAFVDFGTTDPKITLPSIGTYHIFADVAVTAGATAADDYRFKLRNETTSTDVSGSDSQTTNLGASAIGSVKLDGVVTATSANNVIAIWGFNNTAARGTVNSARTRIRAVREH